ncbi:MAG: hypothetical protein QOH35_5240, partial [Acidobacteriaceae bacterium]|nr:hypothetical protein [Acidobacteriaceae bacterium]
MNNDLGFTNTLFNIASQIVLRNQTT